MTQITSLDLRSGPIGTSALSATDIVQLALLEILVIQLLNHKCKINSPDKLGLSWIGLVQLEITSHITYFVVLLSKQILVGCLESGS